MSGIEVEASPEETKAGTPSVVVSELTFTFASHEVPSLSRVNCQFDPGTWSLVRGDTGSGKSTLLRAIAGWIPHHSSGILQGTVRVSGQDTRLMSPRQLASHVGLALQSADDQICATTLRGELSFGLQNLCLDAQEIEYRVQAELSDLGMGNRIDDPVGWLSGGERHLLIVASILAMQPGVIVLDEPFGQLDAGARQWLVRRMNAIRDGGGIVIQAEHRFESALSHVDRVLSIDRGTIVADEPASAMVATSSVTLHPRVRQDPARHSDFTTSPPMDAANSKLDVEQPTLLQVQNLTRSFRDSGFQLWKSVSFDVRRGDSIALLGNNGSGKSTLLGVLAGIEVPTSGAIQWRALNEPDAVHIGSRPEVSLVLQNFSLQLFSRRVRQELEFGLKHLKLDRLSREARIERISRDFEIAHLLDCDSQGLSRGEQWRVCAAATAIMFPRLLLLDEPTTAQDPSAAERVMGKLHEMLANHECDAIIFATHDERIARQFSTRAVILNEGAARTGSAEEFFD